MIVAIDKNRGIGKDNGLLWHIPDELKRFREITTGHPIIMGRKTYESIGRPLPGRINVILTRDQTYTAGGCVIMHSVEEVLEKYGNSKEELFIIGGGEIFEELFPFSDRLYITLLDEEFKGDTYFPEFDANQWEVVSDIKGLVDRENHYAHTYYIYERKNNIK